MSVETAMRFTIDRLCADVMARLGEAPRPRSAATASGVPWPEDIISVKVGALLTDVGSRLIRGAPAEILTGGPLHEGAVMMRLMPCGLYGAEVTLPQGFLRLVSVKMAGWGRSVAAATASSSADWSRQWSEEAGIAGSPERPRAYLGSDGGGALLRLMGCADASDMLEWLQVWVAPSPGEDGGFEFPEALYGELTGALAASV